MIFAFCDTGLQEQGVESPQVFLVSSFDLHLYDFPLLHETLKKELSEHKRNALLSAMPNISLQIISKKKEAFKAQIRRYAFISAAGAAVPLPGLSLAVDLALLVKAVKEYVVGFGLDETSLKTLSDRTGVPLNIIMTVIKSPLAAKEITSDLVMKLLLRCASTLLLMQAEEGLRFIPLFGTVIAASLSFVVTERALNTFLDVLAEDAQRVFQKALGLDTSV